MNVEIKGIEEIQGNIKRLMSSLSNKDIRISLNKASAPVKASVVSFSPSRSGGLKKSFRIKVKQYRQGKAWVSIIGSTRKYSKNGLFPATYGPFVDSGTVKMKAHPFRQPALQATKGVFISLLTSTLRARIAGQLK